MLRSAAPGLALVIGALLACFGMTLSGAAAALAAPGPASLPLDESSRLVADYSIDLDGHRFAPLERAIIEAALRDEGGDARGLLESLPPLEPRTAPSPSPTRPAPLPTNTSTPSPAPTAKPAPAPEAPEAPQTNAPPRPRQRRDHPRPRPRRPRRRPPARPPHRRPHPRRSARSTRSPSRSRR